MILSLRRAVWGPKPFRFPCVSSPVLRGRGVARLGPGRGHMGTEEQGLHGAARTGPRYQRVRSSGISVPEDGVRQRRRPWGKQGEIREGACEEGGRQRWEAGRKREGQA